jgi:hypothetical protein
MPIPEWVDEAKQEWHKTATTRGAPFRVRVMTPVTSFSTLFAEYFFQGEDFVFHLFPRNGAGDIWEEGRYTDWCRSCHSRVEMPKDLSKMVPCPRCGHCGLIYIPGRKEEKATVFFPGDMRDKILEAANAAWMGDVAIELVPELGAYAVQFQGAKTPASTIGPEKFADGFCSMLDTLLESET